MENHSPDRDCDVFYFHLQKNKNNSDGRKIVHLIPGDETADGRRDVNCGTDLDRSDECFYHPVISTTTTTCDDVERVGGGGEGGRGVNSERGVTNHWHRVTPDCC